MKVMKFSFMAIGFLAFAGSGFTQATNATVAAHWDEVSKIVGKSGTVNADGSYRINIARTDVKFTNASGMSIPADLGL